MRFFFIFNNRKQLLVSRLGRMPVRIDDMKACERHFFFEQFSRSKMGSKVWALLYQPKPRQQLLALVQFRLGEKPPTSKALIATTTLHSVSRKRSRRSKKPPEQSFRQDQTRWRPPFVRCYFLFGLVPCPGDAERRCTAERGDPPIRPPLPRKRATTDPNRRTYWTRLVHRRTRARLPHRRRTHAATHARREPTELGTFLGEWYRGG